MKNDFSFGIETEFQLINATSKKSLWYQDTPFKKLNAILENISLEGIKSLEGLELEAPHKKNMPYIVEGYNLPDQDWNSLDMLPKGIEIRTPVCNSIAQTLTQLKTLFDRLRSELKKNDLLPLALSHHLQATKFSGPQNKRRHDYWQWAMEVMVTYGPDFNIGLPDSLWAKIDFNDLLEKFYYYGPAMTCFSLASPIREESLWNIRGAQGKSVRTYRRSIIAPPIELHPEENNRLEFKLFDVPATLTEYEAYFGLVLTVLLTPELKGRASRATFVYDMGQIAIEGLHHQTSFARASEIMLWYRPVKNEFNISHQAHELLVSRLEERSHPSDAIAEDFIKNPQKFFQDRTNLS
jgi:carboxylate-amine ligase